MRLFSDFFILLFVMMIFSSCASKKQVVEYKPKKLPSWYLKVYNSDIKTIYATGDGKTKDNAVTNALNSLVSKLSVTISSTYKSRVDVSLNSYHKRISQDIKSEVSKIRVSEYKIVKFQKIKYNKYIVLISINKSKLFSSIKKELDIKIDKLKAKESLMLSQNILQKYLFYKKASITLDELTSTLMILKVLNNNFNDNSYLQYINNITKKLFISKQRLNFKIIDENCTNQSIVSIIKGSLSDKGFNISSNSNKDTISIFINTTVNKSKINGFYILYYIINMKTKNKTTTIGSNIIKLKGATSQSFDVSKNKATFKFKKIVQDRGIDKILGIQI